jgi:hypothetical protein
VDPEPQRPLAVTVDQRRQNLRQLRSLAGVEGHGSRFQRGTPLKKNMAIASIEDIEDHIPISQFLNAMEQTAGEGF